MPLVLLRVAMVADELNHLHLHAVGQAAHVVVGLDDLAGFRETVKPIKVCINACYVCVYVHSLA